MKLKILIAEPSQIIVEGLQSILHDSPRLDVVSTVGDMSVLDERIMAHHPDIVVLNPCLLPYYSEMPANIDLPDGVFLVALVYQYFEPSYLRNFDAVIDIREPKQSIISTLTNIDRLTDDGGRNAASSDATELTKRERDVLVLVAKGLMSKEIAEQLNISIHTVISHRKNITKKTGIKSVAGLAVYAMLNNLMTEPMPDTGSNKDYE